MNRCLFNLITLIVLSFSSLSYCSEELEPIAIYLLLKEDPTTTMVINWITDTDHSEDLVVYQEEGDLGTWSIVNGYHNKMPDGYPQFLHRVVLTDLKPDTSYTFRLGFDGKEYKFRTLPIDPEKEVRFVVGGDVYHDTIEILEVTNRNAAATNPMFAMLGGDIAYTASKVSIKNEDRDRWIDFLASWGRSMITPDGYLIPLMTAIGNHDVNGRYGQTPVKAPYYYFLLTTPETFGYYTIDIGHHIGIIVLDSNHTHPCEGEQAHWLYHALEYRDHFPHKFVMYHVPAYPSVRTFKKEKNGVVKDNWVPIMETFGVTAVFEHHDHAYKRTHPIFHDKINEERGILYLGDGAWGVDDPRTVRNVEKTWYLANAQSVSNFLFVSIKGRERTFIAFDNHGNEIDRVVRNHDGSVKVPKVLAR